MTLKVPIILLDHSSQMMVYPLSRESFESNASIYPVSYHARRWANTIGKGKCVTEYLSQAETVSGSAR